MLFNGRQLRRAVGDFVELRRRRINSIREYAATTTVFMFATWTLVQMMFVLVGLVAMTVPSPNRRVAPTSYVLTGAFVMTSFFLAVGGYIIDQRRKALIAKINSMEEGFSGTTEAG
jgi:hypothetical protein